MSKYTLHAREPHDHSGGCIRYMLYVGINALSTPEMSTSADYQAGGPIDSNCSRLD